MPINPYTQVSTIATKVPKFLRCLYDILHFEDQRILAWSHDGTCFQVRNVARLETEVLPKYFKHGKFTSFQRQLNNFGFHKWTKTRANVCTFSHDALVRCHPSQLDAMISSYVASKVVPATTNKLMPVVKRQRIEEPTSVNEVRYATKKIKSEPLANHKAVCFEININMDTSSDENLESGAWTFDSIEVSDLCALDWTQGMSDAVTDLMLEPLSLELESEPLGWELGAECFTAIDKDFAVSTSFLDVSGW
ncbi:hypothetical protein Gpo141_00006797 [Globisporangium polare]